jgi:hypothetical protein
MSQPILSNEPSEQDEWSIEFSGEVGSCVTPPVDDGPPKA